jgi:thioredoxin-like negative regulator of GroEL
LIVAALELNPKMAMELTGRQLDDEPWAVFIYTPLCGTCKAARRMLEVVLAMEPDITLFEANLNALPFLAEEWKITSVPCIVAAERSKPLRNVYAMQSVEALRELLKSTLQA